MLVWNSMSSPSSRDDWHHGSATGRRISSTITSQSCHLFTPGKINGWNLWITHLERNIIFQNSRIMFHVNLPGCKLVFWYGKGGNFPSKKVKSKRSKSSKFSLVKSFPERSTIVDSVNERSQNCGNAEMVQFIYSEFLGVVLRVGLWSLNPWAAQGFKQYLVRPKNQEILTPKQP